MTLYHIYRVVGTNETETEYYYGHTKTPIEYRLTKHLSDFERYKEGIMNWISVFVLFEKYGIMNCHIELVEDIVCETLNEIREKEGNYQRTNICVNKRIEARSKKQYRKDNAEKL